MDCSLPGSTVHGILQARILEWVAILFCRDLPDPNLDLLHCTEILYHRSHQESPIIYRCNVKPILILPH